MAPLCGIDGVGSAVSLPRPASASRRPQPCTSTLRAVVRAPAHTDRVLPLPSRRAEARSPRSRKLHPPASARSWNPGGEPRARDWESEAPASTPAAAQEPEHGSDRPGTPRLTPGPGRHPPTQVPGYRSRPGLTVCRPQTLTARFFFFFSFWDLVQHGLTLQLSMGRQVEGDLRRLYRVPSLA